jgi:hypothetical protein
LRVQYTGSFKIFCQNFVGKDTRPSKSGVTRLNQLLGRFMIRRTRADKVMGMPLVVLPKASEQIRWVKFNDVERSIYEIVRSRMIKRINKLSRSKELDANYTHVLTMLPRLRQLTSHILMVEGAIRDLLEREDHEKIYDFALIEGSTVKDTLRHLQFKRLRTLIYKGASADAHHHPSRTKFPGVDDSRADRHNSVTQDEDEENRYNSGNELLPDRDNVGGKHGLEYKFLKYLQTPRDGDWISELNDRTTCVYCGDKPDQAKVTSCYHVYCSSCLEALMMESAESGKDNARCKDCGVQFTDVKDCDDMDFDSLERKRRKGSWSDFDDESDSEVEMRKKSRRWKNEKSRKDKTPFGSSKRARIYCRVRSQLRSRRRF